MKKAFEANFDGLVGMTHHYAGLSFGNEASMQHCSQISNPKLAAKQGLVKMKALADAGYVQGVIPPQERPNVRLLRKIGFQGNDEQVISQAARQAPQMLSAASSASSMWVANAATIAPSADTLDGKVHMTVANLNNKFHRASEAQSTEAILRAIFRDPHFFSVHRALPSVALLGDEGAANHSRFAGNYGDAGLQLFVYGDRNDGIGRGPKRYPARQTLEASQAVARLNQVKPEQCLFVQQNPAVIDQGVFHNDVISVANRHVLFTHEQAFLNQRDIYSSLTEKVENFTVIEVPESQVSVTDAVTTYLFNSQLLSFDNRGMTLVLPEESRRHPKVWRYLNQLLDENNPIEELKVFDLRESMANGGGPACLRLRVVLTEQELSAVNPAVLMNDALFSELNLWIDRWYRDRLTQADLADPQLLREGQDALEQLTQLLDLGPVYAFQQ